MKALVTGGAGFIGSHLVDRLLAENITVVVIDNLETGRVENISHALANSRCTLHTTDISQPLSEDLFQNVDWVFHLAGLADIVPSIESPYRYHEVNTHGTVNVLEAARKSKVKRLVYAASSSCYGIPDVYPTPETAPIRTEYPYAHTKYAAETYVMHWSKVYKIPSIALRLFNVYGPRSRTGGTYGAVFGVFMAQKLAGRPFTVVGDGEQMRDFVYVSDVVEAFLAAARSNITQDIFNIGYGTPQTINTLVNLLGGEKIHIQDRPGEPKCTHADISKARAQLAWRPTIDFKTGVAEMLHHINMWKEAPIWDETSIAKATKAWFTQLA
ncbi:SDR family oxidoreductase [uncultured Desulfobacter sp.]|uniref:SDR family oxidoreductase n=1 Tax=uncultured Desulfobacter sp. TaxID=240139 RepID=UPI0029F58BCA|nr:SDR family oxidoreductase [uncultured Desulfobacter sp.]